MLQTGPFKVPDLDLDPGSIPPNWSAQESAPKLNAPLLGWLTPSPDVELAIGMLRPAMAALSKYDVPAVPMSSPTRS